MSRKIPYKDIMDRIKDDVDYIADVAYKNGYDDGARSVKNWDEEEKKLRIKETYEKGLNDAWGFARHLNAVASDITDNIYLSANGGKGIDVALEMTYEDAKKEYEEYFQRKQEEKIRMGDEVVFEDGVKGVLLDRESECIWKTFSENACVERWNSKLFKKTGRHFDQIEKVLEKLREEE